MLNESECWAMNNKIKQMTSAIVEMKILKRMCGVTI